VTEFIYRFNDKTPGRAHVFVSVQLETTDREIEVKTLLNALEKEDMKGSDISENEFAKSHARYMIGGTTKVPNERVFRFGKHLYIFLRKARFDSCSRQSFQRGRELCAIFCWAFIRPGMLAYSITEITALVRLHPCLLKDRTIADSLDTV
jgi:hypothetical protein